MADADHAGARREELERSSVNAKPVARITARKAPEFGLIVGVALFFAALLPLESGAQDRIDPVTGFEREAIHAAAWPDGKKVAVSFAFFVEEFGFGQGPIFRPDLASRNPDLVNEAFRQYAIDWGVVRVGRLFKELNVPLTIVVNAEFFGKHPSVWKEFRSMMPNAPLIAHGMNNTSRMLPLRSGIAAQKAYIRRTLDFTAEAAGVSPSGVGPSVYSNGDTMRAMAAEGVSPRSTRWVRMSFHV